jgi:aryl-alcohol dehydrogenase-like predicted oxidoreductase
VRDPDPRIVLGLHRSHHRRHTLEAALDAGIVALDTAFSYASFESHTVLATVAADLLTSFEISTKVGFLPGPRHTLDPAMLREAIERTIRDLGREPDVMLLHNPEHTLRDLATAAAREALAAACATLQEATEDGLCGSWGVSSWDTRRLADLGEPIGPVPSILMVRAGLLVPIEVLDASDVLAQQWAVPHSRRWGMSPFGGRAHDELWSRILNPAEFLHDGANSRLEAAFRVAYHLPDVSALAVGSNNPEHLRALTAALKTTPNIELLATYREALRARVQGRS